MEPVVYNEGRWWLQLTRKTGPERTVIARCLVRPPDGGRQEYQFGQADGDALAWYPEHFKAKRPIADGRYRVRWKIFALTDRQRRAIERGKKPRPSRLHWLRRHTVAKGQFIVEDDQAVVARLLALLDAFKREGERLIQEIPDTDMKNWPLHQAEEAMKPWQAEATGWASTIQDVLGSLPEHVSPWNVDGFARPGETMPEAAHRIMKTWMNHLDDVKAEFQ